MTSEVRDDAPATAARDDEVQAGAAGREGENAVIGRTVTINRPREEIYRFWRDFPNLAGIMENVERIEVIDDRRSHWFVKAPAGKSVDWEAKLFQREPNVQARRDLRRLKQFLETGEVTSSAGPSGRDEDPTEQHV